MQNNLTVFYEQKPAYDIVIENDFGGFLSALEPLNMRNRRFLILSDTNVSLHYLDELSILLYGYAKSVSTYVFPAGESSKNLDTVSACYEQLILASFDRNDVLVALGGGVVGDLTGFVAATYLRGIRFVQVPTSLLAMVDSSIGGKTGVDFKAYKNMVGAFHQPELVYMNIATLNTLNDVQFNSGMGEIIKHGLIKDASYYLWLKEHVLQVKTMEFAILKEMIYRSCQIKKAVVEEDPKEAGERALLNFGHTIGHSVEKLMDFTLLHGECVSIGIAAASYLSMKRGFLHQDTYNDILTTLMNYGQPVKISGLDVDEILAVTKNDKKMDMNQIRFILLTQIGHAIIDTTVTQDEMREAVLSLF